ncbi:MAG: hypothetical protein IJ043_04410 [Clostridia bacterium]|nr:hypothetical protein [Clostridia bacterium]
MKKIVAFMLVAVMLVAMAGCGGNSSGVDVNLVVDDVISPMAVYSLAAAVAQDPDGYSGKTVQAEGALLEDATSATGYYIEVADNTGCCYQNFAFRMKDKKTELPEANTIILIKGTFKAETAPSGAKVLVIEADSLENREYLYQ